MPPRSPARRSVRALFALAFALSAAPRARADVPARYDVSYLWHVDLAQAQARRAVVAHALGPRAARDVHVVEADGAYAVVYLRNGNRSGAAVTARAHTRLLKRLKLGSAWLVGSRPWVVVPTQVPAPRADASGPARTRTRTRTAARRRRRTVRPREVTQARSAERQQLEQLVAAHVRELRREGRLSRDERTAWSVYDFTTGETLVEINADIELQSASLVKPFLALAYMTRVKEGKLVYNDAARVQMERMIQLSDNGSADWVMHRLGGPAAVESLLQRHYGDILPGVEIKEYIPSSGRTYRNKASARDYSRFLLALWRGELPNSPEIKRLLALPKRDRIKTGVPLPEDTDVYSKTGSTSRLCGDMGVIEAKGPDGRTYAYTLIGIIEKRRSARHYFRWLRARGDVIREISGLVYQRMAALHGLAQTRP